MRSKYTFYSIFIIAFAYYFLYLSKKQIKLESKTVVIVLLSIFSFLFGYFIDVKIKIPMIHFKCSEKKAVNFCFYFGAFVFFLEIAINRYIPILATIGSGSKYGSFKTIPFLHYILMLEAILPCYYLIKEKNCRIKIIKILFIFFIIMNLESRQLLIFLMLSIFNTLFLQNIKNNPKKVNTTTVLFIIFLATSFIVLGNLRVGSDDIVDYLKAYSGVPKEKKVSLVDLWFNLYTSMNFSTLQKIISNAESDGFSAFGRFTLKPIISLLLLDRIKIITYPTQYNSFVLLGTYICDIYLDFGIIGVSIFNFVYGIISRNSFRALLEKNNVSNIINYTFIIFIIIMFSFTNFFNTVFIFFAIVFNNSFLYDRKYSK